MLRAILAAALLLASSASAAAQDGAAKSPADAPTIRITEGHATTADGIRLYYRVAGDGPETVIAPFALFHDGALDPLAKGRRVVTYDPRGRGRSGSAPPDNISLDHLLADLDTVRRAVGADKVALIGWSGGGMETFVYALRNPGRVTRLVQLAPVTARAQPFTDEMIADRGRRTDAAALKALEAREKAGDFAADSLAHCRARNAVELPALLAEPAKVALLPDVCVFPNEHPEALGRYFEKLWPSISTFDWRSSLAKVGIPRLVVYPLQDNISRPGVEEWVRGQPNARILYVDGSGHLPQYEQPEVTLRAIATFLDGSWPTAARALPMNP